MTSQFVKFYLKVFSYFGRCIVFYEDNVMVSVNGKNVLLPRSIDQFVADSLHLRSRCVARGVTRRYRYVEMREITLFNGVFLCYTIANNP